MPEDEEEALPVGLRAAAALFAALSTRRRQSFHFMTAAAGSFFGGGKPSVIGLPPIGQGLEIAEIRELAELWGFAGHSLTDAVEDVMAFDEVWLEAEWRAAGDAVARFNSG